MMKLDEFLQDSLSIFFNTDNISAAASTSELQWIETDYGTQKLMIAKKHNKRKNKAKNRT